MCFWPPTLGQGRPWHTYYPWYALLPMTEGYISTNNQPSCTMCHRHWLPVTARQI